MISGVTLLGAPETMGDWWAVVRELRLRRRERLDRLAERGQRLAEAAGRTGPPADDGTTYTADDVPALQARAAARDLGAGLNAPLARPVARGGLAYAVLEAVPHWLPPEATPDIPHVRAPTDEMLADLRLPYPAQSLWFGAPADVGPADELLTPDVRADLRVALATLSSEADTSDADEPGDDDEDKDWTGEHEALVADADLPEEDSLGVPWELAAGVAPLLSDQKAAVVGLVLFADDQGRRHDICCWVVRVPVAGDVAYVTLPARRSLMRNPALTDVASALVAWGGWEVHETGAPPAPRTSASGTWMTPTSDNGKPSDDDSDDTGPIRVLNRGSRIWIEGWQGFHIHHALMAGAPVHELTRSFGLSFADLEATWHRWAGQQQRLRDPQGRPRLSLVDYQAVFGILTRYQDDDG